MQHPLQVRPDFTAGFNVLGRSDLELAQNLNAFLKGRENTAAMSGCWTNVMP